MIDNNTVATLAWFPVEQPTVPSERTRALRGESGTAPASAGPAVADASAIRALLSESDTAAGGAIVAPPAAMGAAGEASLESLASLARRAPLPSPSELWPELYRTAAGADVAVGFAPDSAADAWEAAEPSGVGLRVQVLPEAGPSLVVGPDAGVDAGAEAVRGDDLEQHTAGPSPGPARSLLSATGGAPGGAQCMFKLDLRVGPMEEIPLAASDSSEARPLPPGSGLEPVGYGACALVSRVAAAG